MDRPGRRTFVIASVFLLLVGVLHALGHFTNRSTDPPLIAIENSMRAYHVPLGLGMAPSLMDVVSSLTLAMSILTLCLGLMGIVVGTSDASPQVLRRMTFVNLACCGGLLALFAYYRIPPPFVTIALVEVMFVLSLLRQAMGFKR